MKHAVELRDPRAFRALAHPVRIELLGLLRREGPLTASAAGRRIGESSGSASYHLRQLARFGLVEEAGAGRGRERPWRATSHFTSWPNVAATPELADASQVLELVVLARHVEAIERWIARRRDDEPEWQGAAAFGDSLLYLTADELAELRDALARLAEPYLERLERLDARPPGSRAVTFLQVAFPDDVP